MNVIIEYNSTDDKIGLNLRLNLVYKAVFQFQDYLIAQNDGWNAKIAQNDGWNDKIAQNERSGQLGGVFHSFSPSFLSLKINF